MESAEKIVSYNKGIRGDFVKGDKISQRMDPTPCVRRSQAK